jgi:N-acetylglutamate synthase-like GNAT family acetyltransferase
MQSALVACQSSESEARTMLERVGHFDTTAGLLSLDEMLAGSVYQVLKQDDKTVGAYALQMAQHENGAVLWVVAAVANDPGKDLSPHIFSIIEQQARSVNASQIACTTVRKGLIKKLLKMGFEVSGITLRKKL